VFRTLKTKGLDVERLRLAHGPFEKLILTSLIAAITVMQLVHERDGAPQNPVSDALRTALSGNGPGAERDLPSPPTSATRTPICLILSLSKDGAICSARAVGAALAWPHADTDIRQLHVDEISLHVAKGAHAVLLLDRAGWHIADNLVWPRNITPILLPSRSPELNPFENIWQYLHANYLSNRAFETHEDIINASCEAWRSLIALPQTMVSIGSRDWAHNDQS
jgi:DDE superfamily endonuclease